MLVLVQIASLVRADLGNFVLLQSQENPKKIFLILIGKEQITSLLQFFVPNTNQTRSSYQLIIDLLQSQKLFLEKCSIGESKNKPFEGRIFVCKEKKSPKTSWSFPAPLNDILALSLYFKTPLLINENLLEQSKDIPKGLVQFILQHSNGESPSSLKDIRLASLKRSIKKVLLEEDYEKAAVLRDEMEYLKNLSSTALPTEKHL